jgi:hypothetical protein
MERLMQGHTRSALRSTITVFATVVSVIAILPSSNPANAAGTCLSSPRATAPQGSHWYYRTDRTLQRKCWYLASEDRDAASEAAPAAVQSRPTKRAALPATDEGARPTAQSARPFVTKEASNVAPYDALVIPPVEQQAAPPVDATTQQSATATDAAVPQEQATNDVQQFRAPMEQPVQQPVAAATNNTVSVPATLGTNVFQFVFLMLAAIGLLGGAILYAVEIRRRRDDVLNVPLDLNKTSRPRKMPATADGPTFQPQPAMGPRQQRDDVDEALERLSQLRRRRAA